GIILSGGPESTTEENSPRAPQYVFEAGVPVFGVCYGMQTMAMQLGGHVEGSNEREFGYAQVEVVNDSALVRGIEDSLTADGKPLLDVWMSHGDKVTAIPADFVTVASTDNCPFAIMANEEKRFYGVQFHPEVTHTRQGMRMLERFVRDICQCEALWTPAKIIDDAVERIRQQVGDDKVILGLSGGVDSSVTAMLLHRAIGKNLTCVFVDFVEVFDEEALKLDDVKWLAQGTIYPDVIESAASATGKAHVIKSHHNVGGLPKEMKMGLVEPLRELFKDEVRKIGLELGLPYDMLYRHPFPGPGLGVRVLGEVKKEYCDLLRRADAIFIEELHKADLYNKVSQAFTVFLPVRSVGVMGDGRKYDWVVSLRAVETIDFMTAHWAHLPYDFLGRVSNRIINEVNGISRVVYDISGKPPATIEWE
ncbi:MAG: glutamine-hydrolyzing GMP synthase, partial [Klebsiella pneumoniae]|nr:glutamine-hydrolyzing GMP synthase [Klebsiella pneumoniae]